MGLGVCMGDSDMFMFIGMFGLDCLHIELKGTSSVRGVVFDSVIDCRGVTIAFVDDVDGVGLAGGV